MQCQKLLFSATLTRDPAKVAALDLNQPEYYIVQSSTLPQTATSIGEQFSLPSELSEKMIVLEPSLKPLVLIHLIHHKEYQVKSALVFTKSVESANRLVQLLDAFEEINNTGVVVKSYTSEMKPGERKKLLADFTKGDIHLYVSLCLGEQH
jgi:ATP-dependent RNA helicase DDX51/DBP6